jgi:hypothetical protein
MPLDPKKNYLIQEGSGTIYPHTKVLAARKDMRLYDHASGKSVNDTPATPQSEIVLKGNTYAVSKELREVIEEMGEVLETLQSQNRLLQDEVKALREDKVELIASMGPGETDKEPVAQDEANPEKDNLPKVAPKPKSTRKRSN